MSNNRIENKLRIKLDEISSAGQMRSLNEPSGIDFSSNDYLGLAEDPRLSKAVADFVSSNGTGSTGSRLLRGERREFALLEQEFADWKRTDSSLYFATGYQANIGLLQTLLEKGDTVFSDERNHASIIDGIKLGRSSKVVFPHLDYRALERLLVDSNATGEKFVVTESLFSMDGDRADLDELAGLCRKYSANLIVDEAHAVGVFGETGSGLIEEHGVEDDVFLSVNTAGKALGVGGAIVAGSSTVIKYFVNRCRSFIFSTAPMPAAAAAIRCAIGIVKSEPELRSDLAAVCSRFNGLLKESGIQVPETPSHIVPVITGECETALKISETLQGLGFDIRAIRPPTVAPGTSRLRISLNTKVSDVQIKELAGHLERVLSENKVI